MADGDRRADRGRQLAVADAEALVRKHADRLQPSEGPRPDSALVPRADLPALVQALDVLLAPAPREAVNQATCLILAAFPALGAKVADGAAELFAQQLRQDLAKFPVGLLAELVPRVRREFKFPPSIKEILDIADEIAAPRRAQLDVAQAQQRAYQSRELLARMSVQFEAERAREEKRRERQEREELDRRRRWDQVNEEIESVLSLKPGDIGAAFEGIAFVADVTAAITWRRGIEDREAWALVAIRPMAIIGRSLALQRERTIGMMQLIALLELLCRDEAEADRLVGDPDIGRCRVPLEGMSHLSDAIAAAQQRYRRISTVDRAAGNAEEWRLVKARGERVGCGYVNLRQDLASASESLREEATLRFKAEVLAEFVFEWAAKGNGV